MKKVGIFEHITYFPSIVSKESIESGAIVSSKGMVKDGFGGVKNFESQVFDLKGKVVLLSTKNKFGIEVAKSS